MVRCMPTWVGGGKNGYCFEIVARCFLDRSNHCSIAAKTGKALVWRVPSPVVRNIFSVKRKRADWISSCNVQRWYWVQDL